jgi:hypothetical protein
MHAARPCITRDRTRRLRPEAALVGAFVSIFFGCSGTNSTFESQGNASLAAAFDGRELDAHLPADIPVGAIIAAGEQALEAAGHTVTRRDVTTLRGRVVSRAPGDGHLHRSATVQAEQLRRHTRVVVRIDPVRGMMGAAGARADAGARELLDDILRRLGV